MKFQVMRQHLGDRMFMPGETREAAEGEVKHLVDSGVLKRTREKAETAPQNKALDGAPQNKAETTKGRKAS